jgi:hypothetical protein
MGLAGASAVLVASCRGCLIAFVRLGTAAGHAKCCMNVVCSRTTDHCVDGAVIASVISVEAASLVVQSVQMQPSHGLQGVVVNC